MEPHIPPKCYTYLSRKIDVLNQVVVKPKTACQTQLAFCTLPKTQFHSWCNPVSQLHLLQEMQNLLYWIRISLQIEIRLKNGLSPLAKSEAFPFVLLCPFWHLTTHPTTMTVNEVKLIWNVFFHLENFYAISCTIKKEWAIFALSNLLSDRSHFRTMLHLVLNEVCTKSKVILYKREMISKLSNGAS